MTGDLTDPASVREALDGVDAVFLIWPLLDSAPAHGLIAELAAAAPRLVHLSSAAVEDGSARQTDPIVQVHADMEALLHGAGLRPGVPRSGAICASKSSPPPGHGHGCSRTAFPSPSRTRWSRWRSGAPIPHASPITCGASPATRRAPSRGGRPTTRPSSAAANPETPRPGLPRRQAERVPGRVEQDPPPFGEGLRLGPYGAQGQ